MAVSKTGSGCCSFVSMMETSFRRLGWCFWSGSIQRKIIQLLVTYADTSYNKAANKIVMLFPGSVDVERCQNSFCWTERPENIYLAFSWSERRRKHIRAFETTFLSVTTRVITNSCLAGLHVFFGVGQYWLNLVYVTFLSVNTGVAKGPYSGMQNCCNLSTCCQRNWIFNYFRFTVTILEMPMHLNQE
jgi:hypothetical protein